MCKLLPLKLAGSQQECFAQEEDMIHPRGIQLAPLGVQNQSSCGEKALNRSGRCRGSQVPEHEFQCNYPDNFLWKPGQGKTLPLCQYHQGNTSRTFATKEASIFSHHARHSTSCSSENRTLSTKSSTDLVLFIPASALN